MSSILSLLASKNYITVNKIMIKEIGLEEAVIFGELCSEYSYWQKENKLLDDMFYCTCEKLEEMTGLSEYKQRNAIKHLEEQGYITTYKKGIPATRYFYIHEEQLLKLFKFKSRKNLSTVTEKISEQQPKEFQLNNNIIDNNKKNNKSTPKGVLRKNRSTTKKPFLKQNTNTSTKAQNLYSKCVAQIDSFTSKKKTRKLLLEYLDLRLEKGKDIEKPLYTNMWKGMLNKLQKLHDEEGYSYDDIIQQSIENGYLNFYPIKQNKTTYGRKTGKALDPAEINNMTAEEKKEFEAYIEDRKKKGLKVVY